MKLDVMKAQAANEIQNNALDVLKARATDAQSEFKEARSQYQKTAAKGGQYLPCLLISCCSLYSALDTKPGHHRAVSPSHSSGHWARR
jgi:hypothetical protein